MITINKRSLEIFPTNWHWVPSKPMITNATGLFFFPDGTTVGDSIIELEVLRPYKEWLEIPEADPRVTDPWIHLSDDTLES